MEIIKEEERTREFIRKFNELHKILGSKYKTNSGNKFEGIMDLIKEGISRNDRIIKHNYDTLKTIINLRNILQHDETQRLPNVAFPSEAVIKSLTKIIDELSFPITITEFLKATKKLNKVELLNTQNTLMDFLKNIRTNKYSQYPLFENDNFKGIISENSITNWIANDLFQEGIIDFEEHNLKEIFEYEEKNAISNYEIYYTEEQLKKLLLIFEEKPHCKNIIITGKKNMRIDSPKDIVGIINTYDIFQINKLLFHN